MPGQIKVGLGVSGWRNRDYSFEKLAMREKKELRS